MNYLQRNNTQLLLISFIMLFLEIALIRWIATEIRIFAYVHNLVLLACFLGIGLGCYFSRRRVFLSIAAVSLLAIVIAIKQPYFLSIGGLEAHPFRDIPQLLAAFTDSIIWAEPEKTSTLFMTMAGMLSTFLIFFAVLISFIPLGQILGRILDNHKNIILAYSINIIASIVGIWFFSGLSFIYTPPWIWFLVSGVILVIAHTMQANKSRADSAILAVSSILLIIILYPISGESDQHRTIWSPYQKLEIKPFIDPLTEINRGYELNVNNAGFMTLLNLSDEFIDNNRKYLSYDMRKYCQYDIPYVFKPDAENVLILGAGAGNDAAGALRHDVVSVDAIEIDPGICKLGTLYHPEKPYNDARANLIVDDARSYLKKTDKTYDIISFGLLDAHTLSSSYNNTRIDHYVYTIESFRDAKKRLKENGVMTVIFEPQRPWIRLRLSRILSEVFGHPPLTFNVRTGGRCGWGGTMFVSCRNPALINDVAEGDMILREFIERSRIYFDENTPEELSVRPTTDDWPYLYLEKPSIPRMHLAIMAVLAVLSLVSWKYVLSGGKKMNWHFFCLGAGFLLLEFQNISKSSLLFGSTWLVNAFIISAIMLLILLANYTAARFKHLNIKLIYILMGISILISLFIPLDIFQALGFWVKSIIAGLILNLPVFFAGLIFINSFRKTKYKDTAFGSNLLGATAGGLLESLSFVFGISMLLLVVMFFYLLSLIFINKST